MKKVSSLIMALALALCSGAVAAEKQPRVGISCPYSPAGWVAAASWSAETTAESLGLNYMLKMAESEAEQASDLDLMIEQGCEYIILFPFSDALEAAAQRVLDAGVTLLDFDRTLGAATPDYYLAGDNYQIGVLGAEYIAEKLGGEGKVVITTIPSCGAIFDLRVAGCRDTLAEKYPEIEVIGEYAADNAAAETGLALMAGILADNPEIDGVYSCDDELSAGMLKAIEEQGRLGGNGVKVMTSCGGSQEYFRLMDEYRDRIWLATQTCAPYMIGDLVRLCDGLIRGETYEATTIILPETLDSANYADWMVRNGITEDAPF